MMLVSGHVGQVVVVNTSAAQRESHVLHIVSINCRHSPVPEVVDNPGAQVVGQVQVERVGEVGAEHAPRRERPGDLVRRAGGDVAAAYRYQAVGVVRLDVGVRGAGREAEAVNSEVRGSPARLYIDSAS